MLREEIKQGLFRKLLALSPVPQAVVSVTGGGGSFLQSLMATPGISSLFLEGNVPYSRASSLSMLKASKQQTHHQSPTLLPRTGLYSGLCSPDSSRDLSVRSLNRAVDLYFLDMVISRAIPTGELENIRLCSERYSEMYNDRYRQEQFLGNSQFEGVKSPLLVGIGCSAAIRSIEPKRGPHQIHVSASILDGPVTTVSKNLNKDQRTRGEEDEVVGYQILKCFFKSLLESGAYGSPSNPSPAFKDLESSFSEVMKLIETEAAGGHPEIETIEITRPESSKRVNKGDEAVVKDSVDTDILDELLEGHLTHIVYCPERKVLLPSPNFNLLTRTLAGIRGETSSFRPANERAGESFGKDDNDDDDESVEWRDLFILSGSFNPLHSGHLEMMNLVRKLALESRMQQRSFEDMGDGKMQKKNVFLEPVMMFELTCSHPVKGFLAKEDILKRMAQFEDYKSCYLIISNAQLFKEKSALFPGSCILIGYDTFLRIIDEKFYNNSRDELIMALSKMHQNRVKFLVFGRTVNDGKFEEFDPSEHQIGHKLRLPKVCTQLFQKAPNFRMDISSTQLRKSLP